MNTQKSLPKYIVPASIDLPDRQWPTRVVEKSPIWCSADLREANRALANPLNIAQKQELFELLCRIGFRHIEVAFPSASAEDFDFTRLLVENNLIPKEVFISVLAQCNTLSIQKSFEALHGVPRAILHLSFPTSELHMRYVLKLSRQAVLDTIVQAVEEIRRLADESPETDWRLEFSPEDFTDSDLSFILELCEAVYVAWGKAAVQKPLIFNFPATVERRPPNQYADMIEWFCNNFSHPKKVLVSAHTHNDQGMAVAAAELALLAGARRVEGTLFGHGERTGNVDLVTLANNLASRGITTGLDFSNLPEIVNIVERLSGLAVYYRQPYSGEYVFTAFSSTHQEAIRKGMDKLDDVPETFGMGWKVPYLHIDPVDLGRRYESLVSMDAQSGKGSVVWVLEHEFGLRLPKSMDHEVNSAVQLFANRVGREITSRQVYRIFQDTFINPRGPYKLAGYWPRPDEEDPTIIHGEIRLLIKEHEYRATATGNGPVSAFVNGLKQIDLGNFVLEDYYEQAVGKGAEAQAVAYVPLKFDTGQVVFGVGVGTNIDQAAVRAIVAGLNRKEQMRDRQPGSRDFWPVL
jgi:2-isopropylmalate synthase